MNGSGVREIVTTGLQNPGECTAGGHCIIASLPWLGVNNCSTI